MLSTINGRETFQRYFSLILNFTPGLTRMSDPLLGTHTQTAIHMSSQELPKVTC
jgi:hypothetical protein